jgi:hypothetical protein
MSAALPTDLPRIVKIRCEDCARDLGRSAPTLVVATYHMGPWARPGLRDHWELIDLGDRIPSRAARTKPPPEVVDGVTTFPTWFNAGVRTIDQNTARGGRSVELACRKCKRSGWRRRRKLYGVAAAARAAGRSDAYLSLR